MYSRDYRHFLYIKAYSNIFCCLVCSPLCYCFLYLYFLCHPRFIVPMTHIVLFVSKKKIQIKFYHGKCKWIFFALCFCFCAELCAYLYNLFIYHQTIWMGILLYLMCSVSYGYTEINYIYLSTLDNTTTLFFSKHNDFILFQLKQIFFFFPILRLRTPFDYISFLNWYLKCEFWWVEYTFWSICRKVLI